MRLEVKLAGNRPVAIYGHVSPPDKAIVGFHVGWFRNAGSSRARKRWQSPDKWPTSTFSGSSIRPQAPTPDRARISRITTRELQREGGKVIIARPDIAASDLGEVMKKDSWLRGDHWKWFLASLTHLIILVFGALQGPEKWQALKPEGLMAPAMEDTAWGGGGGVKLKKKSPKFRKKKKNTDHCLKTYLEIFLGGKGPIGESYEFVAVRQGGGTDSYTNRFIRVLEGYIIYIRFWRVKDSNLFMVSLYLYLFSWILT